MESKRIISLILVLGIVLSLFTIVTPVYAEEKDYTGWTSYEVGADGDNVIAYYNAELGVLELVGSGATIDDGYKLPLSSIADNVKEIIINEGITRLGNRLFFCNNMNAEFNLDKITFPSTLKSIGRFACNSITFTDESDKIIALPEGLEEIEDYAFGDYECNTNYNNPYDVIIIPSTITSVGTEVIDESENLVVVNYSTDKCVTIKNYQYTPHIYLYSTNTSMLTHAQAITVEENIHFLDEPATSGVLNNGIKWFYDKETKLISFDTSEATSTELPSYTAGTQPWFGASYSYGGVMGYDFGGVSSFGTGALGGLLYGSSSLTVYGSNNLSSAVGSALGSGYSVSYGGSSSTGGSTGGDIGGGSTGDNESQDPSTDTSETGIWIYVNDEEVDFPDVQPRVWFGEVYAPLRFINQDLGATVLWDNDTRTATIQRTTDSGKKVEIKLTVGSSSMFVNGKEYTSEEIGMDATVLIEDGRLLLPGRAIVKAWDDVYFKKVYTATAYRDYYYYEDDGLGEEKLEDIEEIENFTETEVIITPDNEQEVLSNYGDTKILVNAESTFFYTSTPILIPIYVDKTGDATIPTDLYIENKCAWGPVVVKNIEFIKANGWEVKAFNTFDFKNTLADSKYIGLTINDVVVGENGSVDMNESLSSSILYKSKKQLTFDAKIPAQRSALKEICAGIVFTVDFDKIAE